MMTETNTESDVALVCARCGNTLFPGSGNYYQVTIEAIADPTPPQFSPEDLLGDTRQKIEKLLKQLGCVW